MNKEEKLSKLAPESRGPFDNSLFNMDVDEEDFRQWARENDPPELFEDTEVLHPYVRDEWYRLGVLPEKKQEYSI